MQIVNGLILYQHWIYWVSPSKDRGENIERVNLLVKQGYNPFHTYQSDQILANYPDLGEEHIEYTLPIYERLASYRPYPGTLIKLSVLQAINGETVQSIHTAKLTLDAYPSYKKEYEHFISLIQEPEITPLKNYVDNY